MSRSDPKPLIPRHQFIREYLARSNASKGTERVTRKDFFGKWNHKCIRCYCNYEGCQGWQMVPKDYQHPWIEARSR